MKDTQVVKIAENHRGQESVTKKQNFSKVLGLRNGRAASGSIGLPNCMSMLVERLLLQINEWIV